MKKVLEIGSIELLLFRIFLSSIILLIAIINLRIIIKQDIDYIIINLILYFFIIILAIYLRIYYTE